MTKLRASRLVRYHFIIRAPDDAHDDPEGVMLPGTIAARAYGHRIVRELKEGGYDPPGAVLHVQDETGQTIHCVAF